MKKNRLSRLLAVITIVCMVSVLSACNETKDSGQARTKDGTTDTAETNNTETVSPGSAESDNPKNTSSQASKTSEINPDEIFTARDLDQNPDLKDATEIAVKDGETINITKDGTYHVTGSAKDCTLRIEAGDKAKVQLVLDGVTITNTDFPAIYVISADKCLITSQGTNALTVSGSFRADGETNTDAVIYSRDDIVLNGTGSLSVTSAKGNGVSCKDDLKITGGTYELNTALDSLEANDSLCIYDGTFSITTQKDGMHCENEDDTTLGNIYICGGTFTINAKSDAIQGNTNVVLDGGTYDLKSREGIEGTYVTINGGTIVIVATDDGINAPKKSTANGTPTITVNGGNLNITVGQGDTDAIDSNGDVYINGGTVNITSTVSSIDYDGKAEFNGGTLIINGQETDTIPKSMFGGPGQGRQGGWSDGNGGGRPDGSGKGSKGSDGGGFQPKGDRSEDDNGDSTKRPYNRGTYDIPNNGSGDFQIPDWFSGNGEFTFPEGFGDGEFHFPEGFGNGDFNIPEYFKDGDFTLPEGFDEDLIPGFNNR
ncbi:MAG: carbohydrate-binding domain-containing protein [Lachnospiraceae bacterium]|nr:carbohydrate-binding domain-containing protein [Lachnospiraceae bacterium]